MKIRTVKGEKGSAIVIVLIFLGIISMVGVGLLLQSQLDMQFNAAVSGTDRRLDMSDMGVTYMFPLPPNPGSVTGETKVVVTPDPSVPRETDYWTKVTVPNQNQTDLRRIFIPGTPGLAECTGFGLGSDPYGKSGASTEKYYYVLEAVSGMRLDTSVTPNRKVADRGLQQTTIQMGCLRCQ